MENNDDFIPEMESLVKAVREHITVCPVFREELKKIVSLPDSPKDNRTINRVDYNG